MRSYIFKVSTIFILAYLTLTILLSIAYSRISENHIDKQVANTIETIHESLVTSFNSRLKNDYLLFESRVNEYTNLNLDVISTLYSHRTDFVLGSETYIGFGLYDGQNETYTISGQTLTFNAELDPSDFDQKITLHRFNGFVVELATNVNQYHELYIIFKVNNIIAFFEAVPYIKSIIDIESKITFKPILMTKDKTIYYQEYDINASHHFMDYLIRANYNYQGFEEKIANNESGIIDVSLFENDSWILYSPLSSSFSSRQFYFLTVFEKQQAIESFSPLNEILLALFFAVFVFFAGSLIILFRLIQAKNSDIENARFAHYYAKPYMIRINTKGIILAYNKSFRRLLGDYDTYDKISDFTLKEEYKENILIDVIKKQKSFTAIFNINLEKIYILFVVVRVGRFYLLIGDDVTHIEGKFDLYHGLAMKNSLTDLPNYNQLMVDLETLLEDKEKLSLNNALVAIEIFSFTSFEKVLGEQNASKLLVLFAEIIKKSLIGYPAILYHLATDHFMVLFENIENYDWVIRWYMKIKEFLQTPIGINQSIISIEINVGIFHIEQDKYVLLNPEAAYENTLLALNYAKESSLHEYFVYDVGLSQIASRNQMMENDLAIAIKKNEFYMVFQPQYDNTKNEIVGLEALIRWNNPKYHDESPIYFIKLAEKNNMIIDIGRIVIKETFMIAQELKEFEIKISINISPVQILQAGFVNEIIGEFSKYDLDPTKISLEITETFLISSMDLIIEKLKLLRNFGFEIHMDDFGTGYSSLQYLKDLPITTIKIDKAFIKNIDTDPHSRAIVTMMSNLAKTIGLGIIAEGVEDEKINNLVIKAGCNIVQGFLISPPINKDGVIKLLQSYSKGSKKPKLQQKVRR